MLLSQKAQSLCGHDHRSSVTERFFVPFYRNGLGWGSRKNGAAFGMDLGDEASFLWKKHHLNFEIGRHNWFFLVGRPLIFCWLEDTCFLLVGRHLIFCWLEDT